MKKVIAIISCITIISALLIVSTFAYNRIDDITLDTHEISEREQISEENNELRSVESISLNTIYNYISNNTSYTFGLNQTTDYAGHYIGSAYSSISGDITDYDIDFTQMRATSSNIELFTNDGYKVIKDNSHDFEGKITFTAIGNNTIINDYFKSTLNVYNAMDDVYDNSNDFLGFITRTIDNIVTYMITNNLILIVIGIVIVSLAVGFLVRLSRNKF